ncbi:MAG: GNAT family N-acetyltransferase [Bacillota bacterium]
MHENHGIKRESLHIRPFTAADVDFVIGGQLRLYETEYGFRTEAWKAYITDGVHELADQFDREKDCMYILEYDGVASGCAAIVHVDEATAKFRFFFVESKLRGLGAGRNLLDKTIDFCREKGYERVFLWTFSTLFAARHLYQSKGFKITKTQESNEWGTPIVEERWDLYL